MKKLLIVLFLMSAVSFVNAQTKSTIKVHLKNTKTFRVYKNLFFEKKQNYSVEKRNDTVYVIEYSSDMPEILYLNDRMLYITPGDSVSITVKLLFKSFDVHKDSLYSISNNYGNYIFSNNNMDRSLDSFYPTFANSKYKNNCAGFIQDLNAFYKRHYNARYSALTALNCSKELVAFDQRLQHYGYIFNLLYYEKGAVEKKDKQWQCLTDLIDSTFPKIKFVSADTSLSFVMENLFKAYLNRLVKVKYNNLNTAQNFNDLVNYIDKFPNTYVKQYLIYFLDTRYSIATRKYMNEKMKGLLAGLEIPDLKNRAPIKFQMEFPGSY